MLALNHSTQHSSVNEERERKSLGTERLRDLTLLDGTFKRALAKTGQRREVEGGAFG
jgi:hypothetical protein